MGRDKEYPLSEQLEENLGILLTSINTLLSLYQKDVKVSSGYRPGHYNTDAGGAQNSAHSTCQAIDFFDLDGAMDMYCLANLPILKRCGLYLEAPTSTIGWTHVSSRRPASGARVFIP